MTAPAIITLTTDFGGQDAYVGLLKGVILGICPTATLIDLTHALPPQDVAAASAVLAAAWDGFPPGTIHLAVVDAGAGGPARAIAAQVRERLFVGPDHGLLSDTLGDGVTRPASTVEAAVRLTEPRFWRHPVSDVFFGRDVFAPVAAHLANGVPLRTFGPPLADVVRLPPLPYRETPAAVQGVVRHVDRFGNLITNIPMDQLQPWLAGRVPMVQAGAACITGLARSFADGAPGQLLAVTDCHGWLELTVPGGSAAAILGAARGFPVVVTAATANEK